MGESFFGRLLTDDGQLDRCWFFRIDRSFDRDCACEVSRSCKIQVLYLDLFLVAVVHLEDRSLIFFQSPECLRDFGDVRGGKTWRFLERRRELPLGLFSHYHIKLDCPNPGTKRLPAGIFSGGKISGEGLGRIVIRNANHLMKAGEERFDCTGGRRRMIGENLQTFLSGWCKEQTD